MRSLLAVAVVCAAVSACGPKNDPPPPAEATADATSVELRVAVDLPDTLRRAAEAWASSRRARITWAAPPTVDGMALAEVDVAEVYGLATRGALRAMPAAALDAHWLGEAGRVGGQAHGLPWRAEVTALAARGGTTWPDLARLGDGLLIVEGHEAAAFYALAAASGVDIAPGVTHDVDLRTTAGVEALAFLRRLAVRARSVAPSEAWPDGVAAALLGSSQRDRLPEALVVRAFSGPNDTAAPRVVARPRVLVAPVSGDHGDLGVELARWLASPQHASLLHADPSFGVSMHREVTDGDELEAWLALREVACLPPTASEDAPAWNLALDEAVTAAIERRRAPRAALDEAWARR